MIRVQSIRTEASDDDGFRVLVEPVWPRKVSREKTVLDVWLRDLAPGPGLHSPYAGDQIAWEDFVARYHDEPERCRDFFYDLQAYNHNGGLTLVPRSHHEDRYPAVALKMLLEKDDSAAGRRDMR